ncbi:MAG: hypothetical protein JKY70_03265, partial [Mucilaginibacter sp.]|nr:hypothetical protein [Mucilaginibacter sp.]
MNVKDKWRLELQIEEHRMGHVLRYLREQKDALPVEFVLATATEHTYYGRLDA